MALPSIVSALLVLAVVLARVDHSSCHVLKGSVTCLDCNDHFDLSDIKVAVKCSQVKKVAIATTEEDGTFETVLPSDTTTLNCLARIEGGPSQLYVSRKNMVSRTVKAKVPASSAATEAAGDDESDYYTIATPLTFYSSCPFSEDDSAKCGPHAAAEFGSSKAVGLPLHLPLPSDWGMAPSSFYISPFLPIIGIP